MDFDYLQVLLTRSKAANSALPDTDAHPNVRTFISLVQTAIGGPDVLLEQLLMLLAGSNWPGGEIPKLSVKELATRLKRLGFPGDSLHIANLAARGLGGADISSESLLSLLAGKRYSSSSRGSSPAGSRAGSRGGTPASSTFSGSQMHVPRKDRYGWDSSAQTSADKNYAG